MKKATGSFQGKIPERVRKIDSRHSKNAGGTGTPRPQAYSEERGEGLSRTKGRASGCERSDRGRPKRVGFGGWARAWEPVGQKNYIGGQRKQPPLGFGRKRRTRLERTNVKVRIILVNEI